MLVEDRSLLEKSYQELKDGHLIARLWGNSRINLILGWVSPVVLKTWIDGH